jgi:hypothetical protein
MVTLNGENSTRSAFVAVTVVPVERREHVPGDGAHDYFSPSGLENCEYDAPTIVRIR